MFWIGERGNEMAEVLMDFPALTMTLPDGEILSFRRFTINYARLRVRMRTPTHAACSGRYRETVGPGFPTTLGNQHMFKTNED